MKINKSHVTLPADSFTPVALYLRLRDQFPHTFLMESSDYHTRRNSFSYIGVQSIAEVRAKEDSFYTEIEGLSKTEKLSSKLELPNKLQSFINQFEADDIFPQEDFEESGFFGATGFDGVQYFEDIHFEKVQEDIPFLPLRIGF